jgi:hypothetical protein
LAAQNAGGAPYPCKIAEPYQYFAAVMADVKIGELHAGIRWEQASLDVPMLTYPR